MMSGIYYSGGKILNIDEYKKKYRNNLQEFEILLHHCHNGFKNKNRQWVAL